MWAQKNVLHIHMRGDRYCKQKLPPQKTMGGGEMANLEKGVCVLVWVSVRETVKEYPSHEKKENRAGPFQTASQIFRQCGYVGFG